MARKILYNDPKVLGLPKAADFPALKHFFPCSEITGSSRVVDTIGGVEILTDVSDGNGTRIVASSGSNQDLAAGSWAVPGTKKQLVMVLGSDAGAFQFAYGSMSPAGNGMDFRGSANQTRVTTDPGSPSFNAITLGTDELWAIAWDNGGSHTAYQANSSSVASLVNTETTTAATLDLSAGVDNSARIEADAALYGIMIFHFNAIPPDILLALSWTHNRWVNDGKKCVWPAWRGVL